jgi:hypothetical protein
MPCSGCGPRPRARSASAEPDRAFGAIVRWLAQPCAVIGRPGDRHAALVRQLLRPLGTAGNLGSDAHLAALAIEYGAELNSCHSDVSRSTSAG